MSQDKGNSILPILVLGVLSLGILFGYFMLRKEKKPGAAELRLREVIALIEENYVDQVSEEILLENALVGLSKGFPEEQLVSKTAMESSDLLRKFGLITFPGDPTLRVTNIFPGSVSGILGIRIGDRIEKIRQENGGIAFTLLGRSASRNRDIIIPDSFAVFDQPVLDLSDGGKGIRFLCLSPSMNELSEHLNRNSSLESSILDLRWFSNVGVIGKDFQGFDLKVDSIVEGPYTFGLGELVKKHFEEGKKIYPIEFETRNFTLINSGGKKFPKSVLNVGTEDQWGSSLSQVLQDLWNRTSGLESLNRGNIGELENLDPIQHFQVYKGIRKNGLKDTYKNLL